jgi:hypothetical protein
MSTSARRRLMRDFKKISEDLAKKRGGSKKSRK